VIAFIISLCNRTGRQKPSAEVMKREGREEQQGGKARAERVVVVVVVVELSELALIKSLFL
jgi:hypothetical protein